MAKISVLNLKKASTWVLQNKTIIQKLPCLLCNILKKELMEQMWKTFGTIYPFTLIELLKATVIGTGS